MSDLDAFDPTPTSHVDALVDEIVERAREMAAAHVEEARIEGLAVHPEDEGSDRVVSGETLRILDAVADALKEHVQEQAAEREKRWPRSS